MYYLKITPLKVFAIEIGSMTRHCDVAASEIVSDTIPALSNLANHIGDAQVRHRGTIGGSLANNDPAADYPAGVLGLGATIITDKREIVSDDFFVGLFETELEDEEIIKAVRFPKSKEDLPLSWITCFFPGFLSKDSSKAFFNSSV